MTRKKLPPGAASKVQGLFKRFVDGFKRKVDNVRRPGTKPSPNPPPPPKPRIDVVDPKKFDPNALKGRTMNDVTASIPSDWVKRPSKSGGGTVYADPVNKGRQIRIMPGYTAGNRPDPLTHGPYVEVAQNGKTVKIPLDGNPTLGGP